MYSIAIADDNLSIYSDIISIISSSFPEFTVSGTYRDGDEMIASFKTSVPDVVIADIRMPKKDGIAVCKYIREHNLPVQIILISAYEDFEALKKAIEYQVSAFIPKPFSRKDIENALSISLRKMHTLHFSSDPYTFSILESRNRIASELKDFYYQKIKNPDINKEFILLQSTPIIEADIYEVSYQCSPEDQFALDFESNHLSSFVLTDQSEKQYIGVAFCLHKQYLEDMLASCKQEAAFSGKEFVFSITPKMSLNRWKVWCQIRNSANKAAAALLSLNTAEAERCLLAADALPPADISLFCEFINQVVAENGSPLSLKIALSADELHSAAYQFIKEHRKSKNSIANLVMDYINEHYADPSLSTPMIAKHFGMNDNYLGRKFKTQTGMGLPDTVNAVRIKKATQYLLESDMTVDAVAHAVGFSTTHYFYKIFKETTGVSPAKFCNIQKGKS